MEGLQPCPGSRVVVPRRHRERLPRPRRDPALTPAIKAKIFGQNAARIYGIDLTKVAGANCTFSPEDLERARQETALSNRTYGPRTPSEIAASFAADHPWTNV